MRLFFAVGLQQAATRAVRELQESLRRRAPEEGLRWVSENQLHYTLKFLGEVDDDRAVACCDAARRAVEGLNQFSLTLAGLGAFPSRRAPRVVWVGASEGADQLSTIASRLERELIALGFPAEERPFSPHLTLARVKGLGAERLAAKLLDNSQVETVASTQIDTLLLMQSHLQPSGAVYSVVDKFALGAPSGQ